MGVLARLGMPEKVEVPDGSPTMERRICDGRESSLAPAE
jgi:hypothetical protein